MSRSRAKRFSSGPRSGPVLATPWNPLRASAVLAAEVRPMVILTPNLDALHCAFRQTA